VSRSAGGSSRGRPGGRRGRPPTGRLTGFPCWTHCGGGRLGSPSCATGPLRRPWRSPRWTSNAPTNSSSTSARSGARSDAVRAAGDRHADGLARMQGLRDPGVGHGQASVVRERLHGPDRGVVSLCRPWKPGPCGRADWCGGSGKYGVELRNGQPHRRVSEVRRAGPPTCGMTRSGRRRLWAARQAREGKPGSPLGCRPVAISAGGGDAEAATLESEHSIMRRSSQGRTAGSAPGHGVRREIPVTVRNEPTQKSRQRGFRSSLELRRMPALGPQHPRSGLIYGQSHVASRQRPQTLTWEAWDASAKTGRRESAPQEFSRCPRGVLTPDGRQRRPSAPGTRSAAAPTTTGGSGNLNHVRLKRRQAVNGLISEYRSASHLRGNPQVKP
jgi:hypothetical protein